MTMNHQQIREELSKAEQTQKAKFEAFMESDESDFLDDDNESFASVAEKTWAIAYKAAITTLGDELNVLLEG